MSLGATIAIYAALLALLIAEFFVRGLAAMAIGGVMAIAVALTFMRLVSTRGVASAFALASVFWLAVLLGLGSMDPATRHDVPVSQRTER